MRLRAALGMFRRPSDFVVLTTGRFEGGLVSNVLANVESCELICRC